MTRLTKLLRRSGEAAANAPPPLGIGALVGVVQPLLLQMIVEGKAGDGDGGHELKQAEIDRGANVTDSAVVALGAVAGALPWMQYQQLLGQHLRLMKRHAGALWFAYGCWRRAVAQCMMHLGIAWVGQPPVSPPLGSASHMSPPHLPSAPSCHLSCSFAPLQTMTPPRQ